MRTVADFTAPEPAPVEPVADFATPEPASVTDFTAADAAPVEPLAAEPAPVFEPAPPVAEAPAFEPVAETPDFEQLAPETPGFEQAMPEPLAAAPDPEPLQSAPEPAADLNDREKLFSQPMEAEAPPSLAGDEIANPYAQESDEADVVDPAAAFAEEAPEPSGPTQIVNPYAEVSNEAEVIDPAMALSNTDQVVEEAEHEVFTRSDPAAAFAEPEGPAAEEFGYAGDQYAPAEELPATSRTESVAPPGMEGLVVGGIVVAEGGRGSRKAAPSM